jgi:surfeit locus 1 family protein
MYPRVTFADARRLLLTPLWIFTTLVVIAGVLVMARLGIWQLERMEWRRSINAQVAEMQNLPALDLNAAALPETLPAMEHRAVHVTGEYVPNEEILLRNQVWEGQPGYHVLTPLRVTGTPYAVLVDRGWISLEEDDPQSRVGYAETGTVTVNGWIRLGQEEPRFGGRPDPQLADGQTRLDAWNFINLERIASQVSAPLLPVYILAAPQEGSPGLKRSAPEVDLSEGPHLGYAVQWFLFASMLGLGYPYYVRNQLQRHASHAS